MRARKLVLCLLSTASCAALLRADGVEVNGGFETLTGVGWNEWKAPWSGETAYDYAWADSPFEGDSALYIQATRASFGVYQEFCVEPGVAFEVSWAWQGRSAGNGWWEVLIVDAPYSYEAVDDPLNHPETFFAAKWEVGFGGAYPEPTEEWSVESFEITPISDTVTVVLKCGSSEGNLVEAWFDAISVTHESSLVEIFTVVPSRGKTAGGEPLRVLGRNLPADAVVTLGSEPLVESERLGTCEISGLTPPGEPGDVDVTLTTPRGTAVLPGGFRYVAPPTITSITPDEGPVEGGTEVTIRGEHFVSVQEGDVEVTLGESSLEQLEVVDETTLTGTTPAAAAGTVGLVVRTPFGEAVSANAFTYTQEGTLFRRGDCNADGKVDITDAINILGFLFLGSEPPSCVEACNGDDDASLSISDAIFVLGFLFTGGAPPPAPHPDCGVDPTPGGSCEAGHSSC